MFSEPGNQLRANQPALPVLMRVVHVFKLNCLTSFIFGVWCCNMKIVLFKIIPVTVAYTSLPVF